MSSRPGLVQPCPADGQSVRPVRGVYDPGRLDIRRDETQVAPPPSSPLTLATLTAAELLRTALLAKLAVDLEDPALVRRAAGYAESSAHLLAGLTFPTYVDREEDDEDQSLPSLDEFLDRMPSRTEVEDL